MSDQKSIPTVYMRGGTSKGLIFNKKDFTLRENAARFKNYFIIKYLAQNIC